MPLEHFRKSLNQSGGGDGVSLHIDGNVAKEYRLHSETEVDVDVIEEDGDVNFKFSVPAGFTREDLQQLADEEDWELTDKYEADDDWSVTYRNPSGLVRVAVDSHTHVNDTAVNNVFIQSDSIPLSRDLTRYTELCKTARDANLRVQIDDSEGMWQRLRSSAQHDTDDAPSEETFVQLLDVSECVSAQLVKEMPSLHTTLDDVKETVKQVDSAMREYDQKLSTEDGA